MRFLMGTMAHNQHVQNIAQALHEANLLGAFYSGGVDHWGGGVAGTLRKWAGNCWPDLDRRMARRRVSTIPEELVRSNWGWEMCRLLSRDIAHRPVLEDWFWERSEKSLDRSCARLMGTRDFDAFLGVEYGALSALEAAKAAGKLTVVAYLSPHHATREKWEDVEFERFPELLTPARKRLLLKGPERNARRDAENKMADVFHCASRFTRDSLIAAGLPANRMICVPLGCPDVSASLTSSPVQSGIRFLYSGPVSVRKGAHVVLAAWKLADTKRRAELHFYGRCAMPEKSLTGAGDKVVFHGNVSKAEIGRAYQQASVLVFPTLCDGFGMVVAEAFANGLPVITTPNAGASDLIVEGRNGFIVPPGNPEALAQRIEWCILHPREVFEMREEALNTARRWNWAAFRSSFSAQLSDQLQPRN